MGTGHLGGAQHGTMRGQVNLAHAPPMVRAGNTLTLYCREHTNSYPVRSTPQPYLPAVFVPSGTLVPSISRQPLPPGHSL